MWKEHKIDLSAHTKKFFDDTSAIPWKSGCYLRFDPADGRGKATIVGNYFEIRDFSVNITAEGGNTEPVIVETYVGGKDGILVNSRRSTRTGYYMRKFNSWTSRSGNNADGAIRLFRMAEIILNLAETSYQSHGPDTSFEMGRGWNVTAKELVNVVRGRADMPPFPAGMTQDEFEKKYRNERRVELAFEEHRYFDVRRWKILDKTDNYVTGMRVTKRAENDFTYERISFPRQSSKEKIYPYPIDQTEADKMQEYTGVGWQNLGWN